MKDFMKCGHTQNAYDSRTKAPLCIICECADTASNKPELAGRLALCLYCKKDSPSDFELPFFQYLTGKDHDRFYCGCVGWE